jgi:phospholipid/cholesterol/gamma-HCH transport system substrate-binding protein
VKILSQRRAALASVLVVTIAGAAGLIIHGAFFGPQNISALFTSTTAIYPGDDVRVAGVKVGTITNIQPEGTHSRISMDVAHDVPIPANAQAVIVAQNLVTARYVQLTPPYTAKEPTMSNGATIPLDRTAVPVEWDEVKTQLMRLATDLGPTGDVSRSSVSKFIDSAANAMGGNGTKLRQALAQLSGAARVLAGGSANIVQIVDNLQTFVTALRDSDQQIVAFNDRLATLSSVLDGGRSDLDAALTNLSTAISEVQRFIAGSRSQTSEQVQRLANVTQNLVDHHIDLENVLHMSPNAFANAYNIYNPDTGDDVGSFVFTNFSSPIAFICSAVGAVENTTAPETAKLCAQYFGPLLRLVNFNLLPIPINPYLMKSASPENLVYADPALAPGGPGAPPGPLGQPPAISAYRGDAPPGAPGPAAGLSRLPIPPSPALLPGAPLPGPPQVAAPAPPDTLSQILLPLPPAPIAAQPSTAPADGTPRP